MSLESLLKERIRQHGPISVADYMALALSHPEYGYYMRKDPLGAAGDFITAPEVSQIFGELIGAWLAAQWIALGKPHAALIELGPGRGTLMSDLLRATKSVLGFHDAVSVHLVETSPALRQKQWKTLAEGHPRIEWHETIEDLPQKPWLLIANEFFDALPIQQFIGGTERRVGMNEKGELHFIPSPLREEEIREYCKPAEQITHAIARHVAAHGGAALLIDYGYAGGPRGDTLQAVKQHQRHEVLKEPGMADLTAHVDFDALKNAASAARVYGPVPQGQFLGHLGATTRAAKLCANAGESQKSAVLSGLERLLSPDEMGDLFKVMAIVSPLLSPPEGF